MAMATVAEAMWATLLRFSAVLAAWLALASAAHAGGPGLVLGATEDAVRSTTLVDREGADGPARARRLPRRSHHAGLGAGRARRSPRRTRRCSTNVAAAAKLSNVTVVTSVLNPGSRTTPLTDADQSDFAAYAANLVRAGARAAHPDRRQRAEPQPLLAAAVQRRRHRRGRARLRGAAREDVRRRQGGRRPA